MARRRPGSRVLAGDLRAVEGREDKLQDATDLAPLMPGATFFAIQCVEIELWVGQQIAIK
jgi:hypothetical protein